MAQGNLLWDQEGPGVVWWKKNFKISCYSPFKTRLYKNLWLSSMFLAPPFWLDSGSSGVLHHSGWMWCNSHLWKYVHNLIKGTVAWDFWALFFHEWIVYMLPKYFCKSFVYVEIFIKKFCSNFRVKIPCICEKWIFSYLWKSINFWVSLPGSWILWKKTQKIIILNSNKKALKLNIYKKIHCGLFVHTY